MIVIRLQNKERLLLGVLYLGFISLGLPDQLLGIAWPEMRVEFSQPLDSAGILVTSHTLFSALSGYFSGYLVQRLRTITILMFSALLTVVGLSAYGLGHSWWVLVLAALPLGLGAGAIDSALNNYVARHYSPKHMNWLHGCWGIGATLGPVVLTTVLALNAGWRVGYLLIAALQLGLVAVFASTRHWWQAPSQAAVAPGSPRLRHSLDTVLSCLFFFVYVTVEVCIGLWFYTVLVEGQGLAKPVAGAMITAYWGSLTLGRFLMGLLAQRFSPKTIVTASLLQSLAAMALLAVPVVPVQATGLVLAGLGLAGIYPSMMNEAYRRFSPETAQVLIGQQVGAACLGFALLVPVIGMVLQRVGLGALIPVLALLLLCLLAFDCRLRRLSQ
jgi:fucose permease